MRWRIFFIAGGLIALAAFVALNAGAIEHAWAGSVGSGGPVVMWAALIAISIHLIGHVFRVLRSKILVDEVNRGSFKGQFGALAIGFLGNALLPFRAGDLIRSLVIARTLRVSLLYTLAVVLLERLLDVILVGLAVLIVAMVGGEAVDGVFVIGAITLIVVPAGLVGLFVALVRENRFLLGLLWRTTGWLNPELNNRARFKIWTLIFGFQRLLIDRAKLWRYLAFAGISWICYLGSMAVLLLATGVPSTAGRFFVSIAYPFIAITGLWRQSGLVEYGRGLTEATGGSTPGFEYSSWLLLAIPMTVLGAAALLFLRLPDRASEPTIEPAVFENKLRRLSDISHEMPAFLDSYFRGHDLARVLHRIEVAGDLSLVRFFRGGSDAVTVLALRRGQPFVKKIVPGDKRGQLESQSQWLRDHAHVPEIVAVNGVEAEEDYFAIDLEFSDAGEPMFDFVHRVPFALAATALEQAWDVLQTSVYRPGQVETLPSVIDSYVDTYLIDRLRQASRASEEVELLRDAEEVVVNGEPLLGFRPVLEAIMSNRSASADLAAFRSSPAIHGDLTIDNLLFDTVANRVVVLDPSDDNPIHAPVLDLGRLTQSLAFGYEFLIDDEDTVRVRADGRFTSVEYADRRSARYEELNDLLVERFAEPFFVGSERRSALFHAGLFYGRMMTHRVSIAPRSAPKYLATSIRALNRFLRQYDRG